ncbi:MAG TPA: MFS transporter [Kribbellaceae bacterium]
MARKWWTLVVTCLAIFMLLVDITIVNVALPAIAKDLDANFSDLQWVIDAYALTLAGLLLTAGTLADRFGRRMVFAVGLVLFTLSSVACALAPTALALILARGVQGVGGAVLFPVSLALLAQDFTGRDRATAFGIWGATTGAAVAVGPLVGGALTDGLSWPWIFYLNVPVGAVAVWITLRYVRETKDPHPSGVDWGGTVTFTAALFCLVLALIRANDEGWGSTLIVSLFVATTVLLVAFVVIEARLGDGAMFDLRLSRNQAFNGTSIAAFALSASMFAMFLYLTLYMQTILGFGPFAAGLRFLPVTVLSFFCAAASGRLTEHVPMRYLMAGGLTAVGVALLLMRGLGAASEWTALLPGMLLAGVGIGLINPALASASIGVVPPQRSGMGSGINSTFRQVGIATGIAALGAIFQSVIGTKVDEQLAGTPVAAQSGQIADAIAGGGAQQVIANTPEPIRGQVRHAVVVVFTTALNDILLVAAVVALAGAVLALLLVRQRDFHPRPVGAAAAPAAEA